MRDSISWGRQADYERREKERESRRADRAERALSQSIRQLHRLGQEPDAIARALSMDVGEVRRVLAASDDGKGSAWVFATARIPRDGQQHRRDLSNAGWLTVLDGPLDGIRHHRGLAIIGYVKTHHPPNARASTRSGCRS